MPPTKKAAPAYAKLDVVTKRIQSGRTPHAGSPVPTLTGQSEPMEVCFINTALPNRYGFVTEELGWEGVRPDEVRDPLPQGDIRAFEGRVVRGERGEEVLVKIPAKLIAQVRRAEARRIDQAMQSKSALSHVVREQAAAEGQERVADRLGDVEIDRLRVSHAPMPIDRPSEDA